MENIRIDNENNVVIISAKIRDKLKKSYLCSHFIDRTLLEYLKSNEIPYDVFKQIIKDIDLLVDNPYITKLSDEQIKEFDFDKEIYDEITRLTDEAIKQKPEHGSVVGKYHKLNDMESLENYIDLIYQANQLNKKMYLIRDLKNAKDDCVIDMKYFLDDKSIESFNNEYTKAIVAKDIDRMKQLLNQVQQLVLKEWEKYVGNIDDMTDENFRFIGHSTSSYDYKGEFRTRFVSCSLFNQDINDTYRSGYGFIMSPNKIVGARSRDMYVMNDAIDEDHLVNYSSISKINHPKRLIEDCVKQKEENIKNNDNQNVYNEVAKDGFEPIGIFCFTDGSKTLDSNYNSALKLQEQFPNLKVTTFDLLKARKGVYLKQTELKLINRLIKKNIDVSSEISLNNLERYRWFLEKFNELKNKENYTEEEILALFKHNTELISYIEQEPENVFSGKYKDEEIKFILDQNYRYGIHCILNGDVTLYSIQNLQCLSKYKDKISKYYEGSEEFFDLINKIEIDDNLILELKNNLPLTFNKMSKCILKLLSEQLKQRKTTALSELEKLNNEYENLTKEKNRLEEIEKKHEFYSEIHIKEHYYEYAKRDLEETQQSLNKGEKEEQDYMKEKTKLEMDLKLETSEYNREKEEKYEDTIEYSSIQSKIKILKETLIQLEKHPILNRKKINDINVKITELNIENEGKQEKYKFDKEQRLYDRDSVKTNIEIRLDSSNNMLGYITERNKIKRNDIKNIFNKIYEYFGCKTLEEVPKIIEEANNFLSTYDYSNSYKIYDVKARIEELEKMISNYKNELDQIENSEKGITK